MLHFSSFLHAVVQLAGQPEDRLCMEREGFCSGSQINVSASTQLSRAAVSFWERRRRAKPEAVESVLSVGEHSILKPLMKSVQQAWLPALAIARYLQAGWPEEQNRPDSRIYALGVDVQQHQI